MNPLEFETEFANKIRRKHLQNYFQCNENASTMCKISWDRVCKGTKSTTIYDLKIKQSLRNPSRSNTLSSCNPHEAINESLPETRLLEVQNSDFVETALSSIRFVSRKMESSSKSGSLSLIWTENFHETKLQKQTQAKLFRSTSVVVFVLMFFISSKGLSSELVTFQFNRIFASAGHYSKSCM